MAQNLFLKTFRDVIEHLVDWGGGLAPQGQERAARRAVMAAYRKTFLDFPWKYFQDDRRLNLDAPYETGTVAYDHTGGTYERQVTLTDGTWPSWAYLGRILFSGDTVQYKVAERKSDTVVTLDVNHCPQADVAANTSYTLFRTEYPLTDLHRFGPINDETGYWASRYIIPDEWLARERSWETSGSPFFWTVMGGRDYYGSMGIRLSGYPDEAESLDFIATIRPRRLLIDGYATAWTTGTVASASGVTVTVSGNTFNDEVVGAVVRLSRNSSVPTDVEGGNPFIEQRIITAASSGTLTVDDTIDTDGVTVSTGYCVSDPIDLPEPLYDLFLAFCENEYAKMVAKERLKESVAFLHDARLQARAWDKTVQTPVLPHAWGHPGWLLMNSQITSTADYSGDPL